MIDLPNIAEFTNEELLRAERDFRLYIDVASAHHVRIRQEINARKRMMKRVATQSEAMEEPLPLPTKH